jgi:hypothetical protein
VAVAVDTGQASQNSVGGVRNQHGVVVRVERTFTADEIQQVRHLFQVGWDVRVVAHQVRVVELDVDDVLNLALSRIELAGTLSRGQQGTAREKYGSCKTNQRQTQD